MVFVSILNTVYASESYFNSGYIKSIKIGQCKANNRQSVLLLFCMTEWVGLLSNAQYRNSEM